MVLTLAGGVAAGAYVRRRFGDAAHRLRVFPAALIVAGVCVLVSRLAHFQPGYLYGLIGGFAFVRELDTRDEGRQTLTTTLALLTVAVGTWAAWTPLNNAVERGDASLGLTLADAALAAVFIAGVEGLLFGLLPLRFLSGEKLLRWSKPLWLAAYTLVVFVFLSIVVRPDGGPVTDSSTVTVIILFVVFAVASATFWAYFRYRPTAATTAP